MPTQAIDIQSPAGLDGLVRSDFVEHYRTALDHLHRAMDAAIEADDLLLMANIAYPIDLVSKAIIISQKNAFIEPKAKE